MKTAGAKKPLLAKPGHRSFFLPENTIRWRPLWPVSAVQIILNVDEYNLEKRLEDGSLPWVFDISRGPDRRRAERRVLAWCVWEYLGQRAEGISPTAKLKFERVVDLILGHNRDTVRSAELGRCLHCQRKHIHELTQAKQLEVVAERLPRRGPASSPRITRQSITAFLERRRMT